jgi:uncharacterized protein (TIGR02145 family)
MHKPNVINLSLLIALPLFFLVFCSKDKGTNSPSNILRDIDGNRYKTVIIGNQVWMAENLKVTHYRNGRTIPNVPDAGAWRGLATGAYCGYNNDTSNVAIYGRLYNWYAVNDSSNIAPTGWHVPSDTEWQILVDYLGGESIAGGTMKEAGMDHWVSPNIGATNESGFTALPGGQRSANADFLEMPRGGYFWSSTGSIGSPAWFRLLHFSNPTVARLNYSHLLGLSIRCVKD